LTDDGRDAWSRW